jgi:hypothetical protein
MSLFDEAALTDLTRTLKQNCHGSARDTWLVPCMRLGGLCLSYISGVEFATEGPRMGVVKTII